METLQVTEERQYRNRGLSHIEDRTYEFFIELEVLRSQNIHDNKLAKLKENLFDEAVNTLVSNQIMKDKWISCFKMKTANEKNVYIFTFF